MFLIPMEQLLQINMTTCKSMKYNWAFKGGGSGTAITVYLSQANRGDIEMAIYLSRGSMSYKIKFAFTLKVNIQIAIITKIRSVTNS